MKIMRGFACPKRGEITQILPSGGGRKIAQSMNAPFLGFIPMDSDIAEACDNGRAFVHRSNTSSTAGIVRDIIRRIMEPDEAKAPKQASEQIEIKKEKLMRIAIPLADGKLSMHFGHCERFALVDVDPAEKKILRREDVEAPPHQPGLLPPWLAERGANIIIAGGMGARAQGLFSGHGIQALIGAPAETPEKLAADFLAGTLQMGENICDH